MSPPTSGCRLPAARTYRESEVAETHRMQVKYSELAQDIAITHGIDQATVSLVLDAYSAAVKRALSEDMIVEVLRDVRLQLADYFDPRNNKKAKRIEVNNELRRLRRTPTRKLTEIEEEDERATERLAGLLDPK